MCTDPKYFEFRMSPPGSGTLMTQDNAAAPAGLDTMSPFAGLATAELEGESLGVLEQCVAKFGRMVDLLKTIRLAPNGCYG